MSEKQRLIGLLKDAYGAARQGRKAVAIHLFGLRHAQTLEGQPLGEIAEEATGKKSYGTELRKSMNLAEFVSLKSGA